MATIEEVKKAIIAQLKLEEITPDSIDANAPLFGEGLGLDSVDAIELVMMLNNQYGINFEDMSKAQEVFQSVATLTDYINQAGK